VDLTRAAINSSLMVNQLVDMDWKFGVTVSSDEIDQVLQFALSCLPTAVILCFLCLSHQIGSTFLQLKFVVDRGSGVLQHRTVELTLPQFYDFLSEMEKAKTYVEFLSGSS
jgi:COMM domain containing 7